jgi:N-methylhydantoinase A/oxoprolinase/acetone carboxylase beta subunit
MHLKPDPGEADQPHRGIRSSFKTPTTRNVTEGIVKAIDGAIAKCDINREAISAVMIGTTVTLLALSQLAGSKTHTTTSTL